MLHFACFVNRNFFFIFFNPANLGSCIVFGGELQLANPCRGVAESEAGDILKAYA
jgi:hypothetical protein